MNTTDKKNKPVVQTTGGRASDLFDQRWVDSVSDSVPSGNSSVYTVSKRREDLPKKLDSEKTDLELMGY